MSKVVVMDHPLIEQKIGIIRRKETGTKDFRQNISEIAMLIGYEATKDLKLEEVEIETPICKTTVKQLKGKKLALVPILRAGLGMVDGMLSLIPAAKVGHIGLYRDPETLEPVEYYCKLPDDCANREVFVVDPMLATGGSAIDANVLPVASSMPGYDDEIIMASGSFTQGSSIEISCDGPLRKPYIAYLQGGLTYEYGKIALIKALEKIM